MLLMRLAVFVIFSTMANRSFMTVNNKKETKTKFNVVHKYADRLVLFER